MAACARSLSHSFRCGCVELTAQVLLNTPTNQSITVVVSRRVLELHCILVSYVAGVRRMCWDGGDVIIFICSRCAHVPQSTFLS